MSHNADDFGAIAFPPGHEEELGEWYGLPPQDGAQGPRIDTEQQQTERKPKKTAGKQAR